MYEFSYKTEASDLWQMAMYYTYSNWTGAINVIFTAAMIVIYTDAVHGYVLNNHTL